MAQASSESDQRFLGGFGGVLIRVGLQAGEGIIRGRVAKRSEGPGSRAAHGGAGVMFEGQEKKRRVWLADLAEGDGCRAAQVGIRVCKKGLQGRSGACRSQLAEGKNGADPDSCGGVGERFRKRCQSRCAAVFAEFFRRVGTGVSALGILKPADPRCNFFIHR